MNYTKKNDFAKKPPRGWNSWDCYGASVTEDVLKKNADYMAKNLKQFGYEYIVCDIQWYEPNARSSHYTDFADLCIDEYGRTYPAENRFPSSKGGSGFKNIADYVHEKGLKFGIHIMRGIPRMAVHMNLPVKGTEYKARDIAHASSICCWNTDMYGLDASRPGAQEYVDSLMELYASWGVDFIKIDDICVNYKIPGDESTISYCADEIEMYRRAIDKCKREIVLSLSPGPAMLSEAKHLCENANMWRITNDFWDDWRLLYNMFERCNEWSEYVSEGCYPDCDMIPVGHLSIIGEENGKTDRYTCFTKDEQKTMITLWSIFGSPLILGCELTDLDEWTKELVTNSEVLELDNNGKNARQVKRSTKHVIWTACGEDESLYVAVFNIGGWREKFAVRGEDINASGVYKIRDLWEHKELGEFNETMTVELDSHACKLFKLSKMS